MEAVGAVSSTIGADLGAASSTGDDRRCLRSNARCCPASAISGTLSSVLSVIAFVFPFKAALQAAGNAFSGAAPGIGWPLAHLFGLALAFAALARVAMRRFA